MKSFPFDRTSAVSYASTWALKRNPIYYNFDNIGGDCSNFVSQCLFAGSLTMNFDTYGWYYRSLNDRAPAWTSVNYLGEFLLSNTGLGPHAILSDSDGVLPGDVVQLGASIGSYYHSLIISNISNGNIFVCAHSLDALNRPLSSYIYAKIRFLHVVEVFK